MEYYLDPNRGGLEYSMSINRGVGSPKRRWIILSQCCYPVPTNGQVTPCSYHHCSWSWSSLFNVHAHDHYHHHLHHCHQCISHICPFSMTPQIDAGKIYTKKCVNSRQIFACKKTSINRYCGVKWRSCIKITMLFNLTQLNSKLAPPLEQIARRSTTTNPLNASIHSF